MTVRLRFLIPDLALLAREGACWAIDQTICDAGSASHVCHFFHLACVKEPLRAASLEQAASIVGSGIKEPLEHVPVSE